MRMHCKLFFWSLVKHGVYVFRNEDGRSFVLMNEKVNRKKVRHELKDICKDRQSIAKYTIHFKRSPLNPAVWLIKYTDDFDYQHVIVDISGMDISESECEPLEIK